MYHVCTIIRICVSFAARRDVRHLACGKALASCPYIVDLSDSVETEALAATRNKDLFPADSMGCKRSAPSPCI